MYILWSVENEHDAKCRRIGTVLPDASWTTNLYTQTGHLRLTYGSQTYPVEYAYDLQGRMETMKTWTDYPGATGIVALTTWNYDPQRGWLTSKADNQSNETAYAYTDAGRLLTRTWERGDITAYAYTPLGDLASVTYTSTVSTPNVQYTYNRRGLIETLTDVLGTRTFTHADDGQVLTETLGSLVTTRAYDGLGRADSVTLADGASPLHAYSYDYDDASRLKTVSFGEHEAVYAYQANSSLLQTLTLRRNSTDTLRIESYYDHLDRLYALAAIDGYEFTYNALNQLTRIDRPDRDSWDYAYDDLGQLTNAVRRWDGGEPVSGQQFAYRYDDIGNRRTATANGHTTHYTADALNRYTAIQNPGAVGLIGRAQPGATVTVNTNPVARQADYFHYQALEDNTAGGLLADYAIVGVANHPTADVVTVENRQVYVPARNVAPTYDPDSNLINDGRWTYTWDGENRLVEMEEPGGVRLAFDYDGQSRRVRKRVWLNEALESDIRYVYDGWNMIAELDASDLSPIRTYVWGLDISGSLQGAGGVGGLLAILDGADVHAPAYDGNGNVTRLVDTQDGSVSAVYEYDPFGNLLRQTGPYASYNPYRFSTKYTDDETGLLYYGYRFYSAAMGRWLNRDPIGENGGVNLYGFVRNNPILLHDILGAVAIDFAPDFVGNHAYRGVPFGWGSRSTFSGGLATAPSSLYIHYIMGLTHFISGGRRSGSPHDILDIGPSALTDAAMRVLDSCHRNNISGDVMRDALSALQSHDAPLEFHGGRNAFLVTAPLSEPALRLSLQRFFVSWEYDCEVECGASRDTSPVTCDLSFELSDRYDFRGPLILERFADRVLGYGISYWIISSWSGEASGTPESGLTEFTQFR